MSCAENLSPEVRRSGRIYAYVSAVFGCVSEIMLDKSAVIILFISMIGGGERMMMAVNSFSGILLMLLLILCVSVISRVGLKRSAVLSCIAGCAGFLLLASAPWFGRFARFAAVAGCFTYSLSRVPYGAAWYPMLDVFLRPEDRSGFFGGMRFTYMIFSTVLFFGIGLLMRRDPSLSLVQSMIALAGLGLLVRAWCIMRFPDDPAPVREVADTRKALGISLHNRKLILYAVYVFLLTLATAAQLPLAYIYLKQYIRMEAGTVQIVSAVALAGCIIGHLFCTRGLNFLGIPGAERMVHLCYVLFTGMFFLLPVGIIGSPAVAAGVLFMVNFTMSVFMCCNSSEMLMLARPGNKVMAMAFVQTCSNAGAAVSQGTISLLLGSTLLPAVRRIGGIEVNAYQMIFGFFFVWLLALLAMQIRSPWSK